MKKYELLKPMGGVAAGAIFEKSKNGYVCKLDIYNFPGYKVISDSTSWVGLPDFMVEQNYGWFSPIAECNHQFICSKCQSPVDIK